MTNAKVMTFLENSKFLQDFLKIFFSKKEGVFAPYNFAVCFPPSLLPTQSAKRTHTAKQRNIYIK